MATSAQGVELVWLDGYGYRCPRCKLFVAVSKRESTQFCPRCVAEDPEQFCPDCCAGMESAEHHEKCEIPAERQEDDLYLARAERAVHLWPELYSLACQKGSDTAVERLAEALHEAAEEA